MDRECVETFLADAAPLPIAPHKPLIDTETGLFADGALDCTKSPFYFLLA